MGLAGIHQLSFDRGSALVIFDSLSALFGRSRTVIPYNAFASVEASYRELFARATAAWQRVVYLSSANAKL